MEVKTLVNLALVLVLLLALRKLIWCLRWLWCWRSGRPTPEPGSFLPGQSGNVFQEHLRQAGGPGKTDPEAPGETGENEQGRS